MRRVTERGDPRVALRRVMNWTACVVLVDLVACAPALPSIARHAPAPAAPNEPWHAPPATVRPEPAAHSLAASARIPAELTSRAQQLTLADVVDIALRNNPATRQSWAETRFAAAAYGAALGAYFPTVDGAAVISHTKSVAASNLPAGARSQIAPTLTLSYLLFDFGGRSGAIAAARENAVALALSHNATLQTTVLQVESAYFNQMAARALVGAQQHTVNEAVQNLTAAQERHRAGVATIADVLQAQTVLAQAQLDLETDVGNVQSARGTLAAAMGLPANADYELAAAPDCDTIAVGPAAASVDTLIARAFASRPDLAAARADMRQSLAQERVARAALLPALTLGGSTGRSYSNVNALQGASYAVTLGVSVPLFKGFARQYEVVEAEAATQAAAARADLLRTQVANEVFTSYFALQTATQRVRTADVLLASAEQSESVARGRYRAGVGTILDLLAAQSALASARAQQVQSRWTWTTALAQLAHDAGVLGLRGEAPIPLTRDSTGRPR